MTVKCINAGKCKGLTEGNEYEVVKVTPSGFYHVTNDNGAIKGYDKGRFELSEKPAEPTIDEQPLKDQAQFPEFIKNVPQILDHEKLAAQLAKTTTYIRREVGNVAKSFCRIGFKLWEAREQKQYLGHEGFKNVYDYAECALGFKKATTANYIAVCERFSVHGEDGKPTMELLPNFASFSYTQLTEMLPLPDAKLEDVNPDMTCKEIREIKNAAKDEDSGDNDGDSGNQTKVGGKSRGRKENVSLFCRKLTAENIDLVVKLLRDNIGNEVEITVKNARSENTASDKSESEKAETVA